MFPARDLQIGPADAGGHHINEQPARRRLRLRQVNQPLDSITLMLIGKHA